MSMIDQLLQRVRRRPAQDSEDTPAHKIENGVLRWRLRDEAQETIAEETPPGARMILYSGLALLIALGIWATFAEIEEVTRGEGKVVPSRTVQIVQSADGGSVAEILIAEGQRVSKNQPLVRIEPVRADAQKGEGLARLRSQQARAARLEAEARGAAAPRFPDEVLQDVPHAAERERALFDARRREREASLKTLDSQIVQRQEERREASTRRDASSTTLQLMQREYDITRPLVRSGAVSEVDLVRLERELARVHGDMQSAAVSIDRLQSAIQEARQRRQEIDEGFRSKASQELAEVSNDIERLTQNLRGLDDRLDKTVLRAPMDGIVKTLHARTVGGVIQPGKEVVEIVPADDTLLIEARVQPRDIAQLHPGQLANARLTAYDFALYGGLPARLERIGADTVTDEKGNAYYVVQVRTVQDERAPADARRILPGMTASVDIVTGRRTVMTYLLKPILRARERAFTER